MCRNLTNVLVLFMALSAAVSGSDVVTVDGAGVTTVAGVAPPAAGPADVKIGGGQLRAGSAIIVQGTGASALQVQGGAAVGNITIGRTTPAAASEAVRGDDPRLTNARPADGGNAATVGGVPASGFVPTAAKGAANGVATLDASGRIPASQLPAASGGTAVQGMAVYKTAGTSAFTVPPGVDYLRIEAWGGGAASSAAGGSGAYFRGLLRVSAGQVYNITVGAGGTAGAGGASVVVRSSDQKTLFTAGGGVAALNVAPAIASVATDSAVLGFEDASGAQGVSIGDGSFIIREGGSAVRGGAGSKYSQAVVDGVATESWTPAQAPGGGGAMGAGSGGGAVGRVVIMW